MLPELFEAMGFMRWPLLFSLLVVLMLSAWSSARLFPYSATADLRTKALVDAVLFWGGFAFVCGILGSLVGIILAFQSIEAAGEMVPTLMAGGLKVALLTSVFGVLILAMSSLIWFGLQMRWRLVRAEEEEDV